jgi:hypothetical protein
VPLNELPILRAQMIIMLSHKTPATSARVALQI